MCGRAQDGESEEEERKAASEWISWGQRASGAGAPRCGGGGGACAMPMGP